MNKIFTSLVTILTLSMSTWAQSPESFSYQAVVRNANGELIIDQPVGLQISILQGSTSGTVVYIESHEPETNSNGLMTLEIGTGTVISGQLSSIDWATGSHFLKTEIDPDGGTNYTITGISQMMSVPYALYAENAGNAFSGDYNDLSNKPEESTFDGDFSSLANVPTGLDDGDDDTQLTETEVDEFVADNGYITDEVDGSTTNEIQNLSLSGQTLTISDGNSVDLASVSNGKTYAVGDQLHGGIVFYVDQSGQHGLICAKEDQSTSIAWLFGDASITGAQCIGIGGGYMNTMLIIAAQRGDYSASYAAKVCSRHYVYINGITYGNWYLPNISELRLMYDNKDIINATAATMGGSDLIGEYWTSREGGQSTDAHAQTVYMSGGTGGRSKSDLKAARAVKAF